MKTRLGLAAVTVLAGLGATVLAAAPVQAAGDGPRQHGCAAHWRNTASWNECQNSPGINVQLQAECTNFPPVPTSASWWIGSFRFVRGSINPADRHECRHHVNKARNAYQ